VSRVAATDLIDVVDEHDRAVGRIERRRALVDAAGFRTVHVLLFAPDGRLLLQRLAESRDRHPGAWGSSVAAYLGAGESYLDAARRRMREEVGVRTPLDRLGKLRFAEARATKFIEVYRGTTAAYCVKESDHLSEIRPFRLAEIDLLRSREPERFTPTFRAVYGLVPR